MMKHCVSAQPADGILHLELPKSPFSEKELYATLKKATGGALRKEQTDAFKKLLTEFKFCDSVSESPRFDNYY